MDPLTTQLAEALRVLARHADDTDCRHDETYRAGVQWTVCCACGGRWADDAGGVPEHAVHPALRAATEALAAYDERVGAEDFGAMAADVGERLTRMGTALTKLQELSDMAESITSGMKKPAIPAALVPVPDGRVLVPRPSVGRRVRSLDSNALHFPLGNEAVVVDYEGRFGSGEDGADSSGDYWASGPGIRGGVERACIGRPGIDFEFVD